MGFGDHPLGILPTLLPGVFGDGCVSRTIFVVGYGVLILRQAAQTPILFVLNLSETTDTAWRLSAAIGVMMIPADIRDACPPV